MPKPKKLTDELAHILGLDGHGPKPDKWLAWLKKSDERAISAFASGKKLVAAGCEEHFLIQLLMALHRAQFLEPLSKAAVLRAAKTFREASEAVKTLTRSTIAFEVRLRRPLDTSVNTYLHDQLLALAKRGERVARHATEKESVASMLLVAHLASYVTRACGRPHDDDVGNIVGFLTDRDIDMRKWRSRHRGLLKAIQKFETPPARPEDDSDYERPEGES